MTAPNAELAYAVLDRIDANPDSHNQGWWFIRSECGTTGCFAGHACLLAGDRPDFESPPETYGSYVTKADGDTVHAPDRARELLGIDRVASKMLFHAFNSREDLGRLVAEIFGPRPEATS